MLNQLSITNFGLIDKLEIDFTQGLNVLTGETGAGKSIIIGALRYLLGERISSSQIRNPKSACTIEAIYDLSGYPFSKMDLFSNFLEDTDNTFIVCRTYNADGRNKIRINGKSITVGQLKTLGTYLTDFHGPHDHQMLFSEEKHIEFLDRLSDTNSELADYISNYEQYHNLQADLKRLTSNVQNREREIDTLSFQINELEEVPLSLEEHDIYFAEQKRINNTEALFQHASTLNSILNNDEHSINNLLREAFSSMQAINKIDSTTDEMTNSLDLIQEQCDELTNNISCYCDNLSFDSARAQEVNDICDKYNGLKRKYGNSFEELLNYYTETKAKLNVLVDYEQNDEKLKEKINAAKSTCLKIAALISKKRKKQALSLKKTIEKELKELGIKQVEFECRVEECDLNENGCDKVTFFISPNAGERLKPLADIVSSGEAARVMLALKKALIEVDPVPVLIFDEIDAQIGGRLGTIIGEKLMEIAQKRQVLLITHLPQIASFADKHLKVVKSVVNGKTITELNELDQEGRINELAHMMSGDHQTEVSLQHAKDLLRRSEQ